MNFPKNYIFENKFVILRPLQLEDVCFLKEFSIQ